MLQEKAREAKAVLDSFTAEEKAAVLAENAKRAPGSRSGWAGVIPAGKRWQARIWVPAKHKQQALPYLWDTPEEEAAMWLAYVQQSGIQLLSPKKVKPRSGKPTCFAICTSPGP